MGDDKMNRKRLFVLPALLIALVFAFGSTGYPWGSTAGDGASYGQVRETAVFINDSGATITSGMVVILDTSATGNALGSTVTTVAGNDSVLAVGVVLSESVVDGGKAVVVTYGAAEVIANGSDNWTSGQAIGTTNATAGHSGDGTNLGIALEASVSGRTDHYRAWIAPTGAD